MKACVRAAHAKYLARLEEERLDDKRKRELAKQKDDDAKRLKREKTDGGEETITG